MSVKDSAILYFPKDAFHHLGDMDFDFLGTEDGQILSLDDNVNDIYYALCDNRPMIDVFHRWGCFVKDGDYKSLLDCPTYKSVSSTDWHEHDGIEPMIGSLTLQTSRDVTIPLYFTDTARLQEFFTFFGVNTAESYASAVHECVFEDLNDRSFFLRLKSYSGLNTFINISSINVTFSVDDIEPPRPPRTNAVRSVSSDTQGYELCYLKSDGTWETYPFKSFGVDVLDGTDETVQQPPAVKENVLINGTYDDELLSYKSKDITFKLLLRADSVEAFYDRYDTFFYFLTEKSPEHIFAIQTPFNIGDYNSVFYKSLKVSRFVVHSGGRIWCELTLVVTCIDDRPTNDSDIILSTEDGQMLCQESENTLSSDGIYKYLNTSVYYSLSSPFPDAQELFI